MEYQYQYKNLEERALQIKEAEAKGYRMLHDNFDKDWKRGDEPHGTLIFTDVMLEPEPEPEPEPSRLDRLEARVEKLEKK